MQESNHDAETLGLLSFALVTSLHIAQKLQGCDGTFYFSHDLRGLFIQMHISIPALHRHQSLMHATHETQARGRVSGKGSRTAASRMPKFRGRCSYKVSPLPWLICNVFHNDSESEASERLE